MWSCSECIWEFLGRVTWQFLEVVQGQNCWAVDSKGPVPPPHFFFLLSLFVWECVCSLCLYVSVCGKWTHTPVRMFTEAREGHGTSLSFSILSLETGSFSLNLEIGMWPASFSNHLFSSSNSSGVAQPWLDPCPAFDTGAYDLNTGPYAWVPSGGTHWVCSRSLWTSWPLLYTKLLFTL